MRKTNLDNNDNAILVAGIINDASDKIKYLLITGSVLFLSLIYTTAHASYISDNEPNVGTFPDTHFDVDDSDQSIIDWDRIAFSRNLLPTGNEVGDLITETGINIDYIGEYTKLSLTVKALLQGALVDPAYARLYADDLIMRDDLRDAGLIPTNQPYGASNNSFYYGTETITNPTSVLADHGNDSIVDWILVDIRDAVNPTHIIATRAGLIQRDGDIVDVDGISALDFTSLIFDGDYYVSLRHRNHLAVMTKNPITMSLGKNNIIDFTAIDLFYDVAISRDTPVFVINNAQALWAGDSLNDGLILYEGIGMFSNNNDINPLRRAIMSHPDNIFKASTFSFQAYDALDINMNGSIKAAGSGNDAILLRSNILINSAGNIFKGINYNRFYEQIPQ